MSFFKAHKSKSTESGKAVGIDLGTTNSSLAIDRLNIEIIPNSENEDFTPSVVSIGALKNGKILVGKEAVNIRKKYPLNTITASKRLMGANFHSEEIKKYLNENRYAYKVEQRPGTPGEVVISIEDQLYTPEDIASEILKKIKTDGEKELGNIDRAVITVPAYFNDKAKDATKRAAEMAGFSVSRLLPEPTAAAISFNLKEEKEGVVLVYDFGGGTFDCSLLNMGEGQFIEMGKSGDMWLGGNDIDSLIVKESFALIEEEYSLDSINILVEKLPLKEKYLFLDTLNHEAENAKITLGAKESAVISVLGLLRDDDGDIIDIDIELTRSRFEELIAPVVEKSIKICHELIKSTGLDISDVDHFLLVGGTVQTPLVQKMMKDVFGEEKVILSENPMSAVSFGAGVLANRLNLDSENEKGELDKNKKEVNLIHAAAHDYYLELANGEELLLVEKNTPLPYKKSFDLKTLDGEQNFIHFRFFNKVTSRKDSIGDIWLAFDLRTDLRKKLTTLGMNYDDIYQYERDILKAKAIIFELNIDENNIFSIDASLKAFPNVKISKTLSRGKRNEQMFLDIENKIQNSLESEGSDGHHNWSEFLRCMSYGASCVNSITLNDSGEVDVEDEVKVQKILDNADSILDEYTAGYLGLLDYIHKVIGVSLHSIPKGSLKKILDLVSKAETNFYDAVEHDKIYDSSGKAFEFLNKELDCFSLIYIIEETLKKEGNSIPKSMAEIFREELETIKKLIEKNDLKQANVVAKVFSENYLGHGRRKAGTVSFNKDVTL